MLRQSHILVFGFLVQQAHFSFQGHIKDLIQDKFSAHVDYAMRDPILYGDYRNALTEEPRMYEDVVDYDATKAVFEEV